MDKDIQTCLTDIASELKGMRHILSAMWHSRYSQGETDVMNPEAYVDEYISIEECAKRLELTPKKLGLGFRWVEKTLQLAGLKVSIMSMLEFLLNQGQQSAFLGIF